MSAARFTHRIRVRYAEVDGQGVVFNAHWMTYFDEACTRFVESWDFGPDYWINEFDVMLVKAVLEWSGPARFDDWVDVAVAPVRIGTKSFDLRYRASVEGRARVRGDHHLRRGRAGHDRVDRDPRPGPGACSRGPSERASLLAAWARYVARAGPR